MFADAAYAAAKACVQKRYEKRRQLSSRFGELFVVPNMQLL